jgi:diguanylate cyclase (GGDEF)-like protein
METMSIAPELFESVFHSVEEHIAVINRSGHILACNRAWQNFGIENGKPASTSWIGQNYLEVLRNSCASGDSIALEILTGMMTVVEADAANFYYEYPCHSPSKKRWFTMRVCKLGDRAMSGHFVISHHDITQRKLAEERAEALALQDPLTGLGNRRQFDLSLQQEIRSSLRDQTLIGVALIDVDHFKGFNDEFGHAGGDLCLCKIGRVLQAHARRPGDLAMRIGGDEFALILRINDPANLQTIGQSILQGVRNLQMQFAGTELVTVSIGLLSLVANPQVDGDTLYQDVDKALYQAKIAGRNQIVVANTEFVANSMAAADEGLERSRAHIGR